MPTPNAPTMLISGIPMHRIKDTTPLQDTTQKLKALGKPYGRILDTATGLGYTAIAAAHTANLVVTVEFDPAVLDICRLNPWSAELFTRPNIQPMIGDSADLVAAFHDNTFNAIIHDPPTFALAGQLYTQVKCTATCTGSSNPAGACFTTSATPTAAMAPPPAAA
jgi:uncharacterized protein